MEKKIAPSLLASDFSDLTNVINKCESSGIEILHLDIMDGHFVPNITFGPPVISKLRAKSKMIFDCHLMIENPDKYIEDFYKAGADWISVHVEATNHLHRSLSLIKSFGLKAGAVLNPITPLEYAFEAAEYCDFILLMSVNPGFGGQSFINSFYRRCTELKKFLIKQGLEEVFIEVDGGVKVENIQRISNAGADVLVSGSGLFDNFDLNLQQMKQLIKTS